MTLSDILLPIILFPIGTLAILIIFDIALYLQYIGYARILRSMRENYELFMQKMREHLSKDK